MPTAGLIPILQPPLPAAVHPHGPCTGLLRNQAGLGTAAMGLVAGLNLLSKRTKITVPNMINKCGASGVKAMTKHNGAQYSHSSIWKQASK